MHQFKMRVFQVHLLVLLLCLVIVVVFDEVNTTNCRPFILRSMKDFRDRRGAPKCGAVINGKLKTKTVFDRIVWPDRQFYKYSKEKDFPHAPNTYHISYSKSLYHIKYYLQKRYMKICTNTTEIKLNPSPHQPYYDLIPNRVEPYMKTTTDILVYALNQVARYIQMDFEYSKQDCDMTILFKWNINSGGIAFIERNVIEIYYNDSIPELLRIVIHEILHSLGLDHTSAIKSIMSVQRRGGRKQILYRMDLWPLIKLYRPRTDFTINKRMDNLNSYYDFLQNYYNNDYYKNRSKRDLGAAATNKTRICPKNFICFEDPENFHKAGAEIKYRPIHGVSGARYISIDIVMFLIVILFIIIFF